jgi:hypothetical protein
MKKSLLIIVLSVFLFGCVPTPDQIKEMLEKTKISEKTLIATEESKPQPTQLPIRTSNNSAEIKLGQWLDTWGFTRTIIITKSGDIYKMTETYSDGSGQTKELGVKQVEGETRLFETQNAYGDYMVINNDESLAFYDDQGFIYQIEPNSTSSSSQPSPFQSTSNPNPSSSSDAPVSVCDTLWDNLILAYSISGGEDTDLTHYYMEEMANNGCPPR